jgi:putative ABC transport system permease protein
MKRKPFFLFSFVMVIPLLGFACSASPASPDKAPSEGLLFIELAFPSGAYLQPQERRSFAQQLLTRIKVLPEVESAAATTPQQSRTAVVEGEEYPQQPPPSKNSAGTPNLTYCAVTPDYFRTIRLALIMGRTFLEDDGPNKPVIVVISESTARRLFPDSNPIGKRLAFPQTGKPNAWMEVVGVVLDGQGSSGQPTTEIYGAYNQNPASGLRWIVRSKPGSQVTIEKLEEELRAVDQQVTVRKVENR